MDTKSPIRIAAILKVHPVADVFPMLEEAELNELAADIRANGQAVAIPVNKEGAPVPYIGSPEVEF